MSDAQINAFRAGSMMAPQDLAQLTLGLFCAIFLLRCSWVMVSAYRGVARQRLGWREFGGITVRPLMLVSFWLVLS